MITDKVYELFSKTKPQPLEVVVKKRDGFISDYENISVENALKDKSWHEVNINDVEVDEGYFIQYLTEESFKYYFPLIIIVGLENPLSDFASTFLTLFEKENKILGDTIKNLNTAQQFFLIEALNVLYRERYGDDFKNIDIFHKKYCIAKEFVRKMGKKGGGLQNIDFSGE